MIAIMILGIGLIMVGTVFPIGLDVSREAMQMNLSLAASDAAVATLKLKVPGAKNLDGSGAPPPALNATHQVLVPGRFIPGTNLYEALDQDANIDANEQTVILGHPFSNTSWGGWGDPLTGRVRVFTERTGWSAEMNPSGNRPVFVVPGQNLPVDYRNFPDTVLTNPSQLAARLTTMEPIIGLRTDLPRIHIVDQVYPPVSLVDVDGVPLDLNDPQVVRSVLNEVASRRYSWIALHQLMSSSDNDEVANEFIAIIMVTYRSDLSHRYARQEGRPGTSYDVNFILPNDTNLLKQQGPAPAVDPATNRPTDSLFPQPWLVMLDEVDMSLTPPRLRCTEAVARLLPANSFFVVARGAASLEAGSRFRVTRVVGMDGPDSVVMELQGFGGNGTSVNVPIWVVPPAIQSRSPVAFASRSPVIDWPIPRRLAAP